MSTESTGLTGWPFLAPPVLHWNHLGVECAYTINNFGATPEFTADTPEFVREMYNPWYCGYVRIPEGHPWRKFGSYYDIPAIVHGDLTYGPYQARYGMERSALVRSIENSWDEVGGWVGFDCRHYADEGWTAEMVVAEVNRLATQVATVA